MSRPPLGTTAMGHWMAYRQDGIPIQHGPQSINLAHRSFMAGWASMLNVMAYLSEVSVTPEERLTIIEELLAESQDWLAKEKIGWR